MSRSTKTALCFTRVGDFYEMYGSQVEEFAPLVNLKKAKRNTLLGDIPMAGFQHTQLDRYLKMFVSDLGKSVAISEQVPLPQSERDGRNGGPLFDRKVNRVVTAGTLVDESFLNAFENNYLLSIQFDQTFQPITASAASGTTPGANERRSKVGLSWIDLSNGEFFTQASDLTCLQSLIARINPREIVLDPTMATLSHEQVAHILGEGTYSIHIHQTPESTSSIVNWTPMLECGVPEAQHFEFTALEVIAASRALDYAKEKLPDTQILLQPPVRRSDDEYMSIDKQSLRGLEIRVTIRDGLFQGSLLHAMRKTVTKSGARLLSQRLVSPSLSLSTINQRLDLVQELLSYDIVREDIVALLRRTADTLRLLQKFSIGRGDADDLIGLARTIEIGRQVFDQTQSHAQENPECSSDGELRNDDRQALLEMVRRLDLEGPIKVAKKIIEAIDEEGLSKQHGAEDEMRAQAERMSEEVEVADALDNKIPNLARRASSRSPTAEIATEDIWIMRKSASPNLKQAHADLVTLLETKQELTQRLRSILNSESLTLKWSGAIGHHCHVKGKDTKRSLANLPGARETGSSKSTRTFYYTEWTQVGARIENAKLRIRIEEERVFAKLRAHVIENLMKLRRNAAVLDELDVACSAATVAKERNFVRPNVNNTTSHRIVGGRHPTVDVGLRQLGRSFTSNDCFVGDTEQIYLITGPNMAGKSTYLRQNALITILAQTGYFVPAEYAEIGLVDKIFSRVGSADSLYQDRSTFMVEMLETAEILKQATPRSFVIMDEVGRGTTPQDGLAVAYACLHHLHHTNQSRTLFATHFHALADMTARWAKVGRYCTDVDEDSDGKWSYLHKLQKGVNRQSHALKVAELAGVPSDAIEVARRVLADLDERTGKKKIAGERQIEVPRGIATVAG